MAVVVSLHDFVEEMQIISKECHAYVNRVTGEIVSITDDEISALEADDDADERPDWEEEAFEEVIKIISSDDFIELPSQYDIHEYAIMERFCLSISDEKISEVLLDKIQGSGAFRRFKETIYRYGIEEDWFQFRYEAFKEIAIAWLIDNCFEYSEDMPRKEQSS
jgi:hypothetical protein